MIDSLAVAVLLTVVGTSWANSFDDMNEVGYSSLYDEYAEPRFLFANFTSGLVQVNTTILTYALIAALVGGAVILVFYYLYTSSSSSSRYGNYGNYYDNNYDYANYQQYYRSADTGIDFSNLNVIQWISMLQEIYEKFDYNDMECQKRLICEVMQSPEYFGDASMKMKSGFEYARFLEVISMPDDFREVLDEYIDASERAVGQKSCHDYFECPYSLKDSVKRNFYGNAL